MLRTDHHHAVASQPSSYSQLLRALHRDEQDDDQELYSRDQLARSTPNAMEALVDNSSAEMLDAEHLMIVCDIFDLAERRHAAQRETKTEQASSSSSSSSFSFLDILSAYEETRSTHALPLSSQARLYTFLAHLYQLSTLYQSTQWWEVLYEIYQQTYATAHKQPNIQEATTIVIDATRQQHTIPTEEKQEEKPASKYDVETDQQHSSMTESKYSHIQQSSLLETRKQYFEAWRLLTAQHHTAADVLMHQADRQYMSLLWKRWTRRQQQQRIHKWHQQLDTQCVKETFSLWRHETRQRIKQRQQMYTLHQLIQRNSLSSLFHYWRLALYEQQEVRYQLDIARRYYRAHTLPNVINLWMQYTSLLQYNRQSNEQAYQHWAQQLQAAALHSWTHRSKQATQYIHHAANRITRLRVRAIITYWHKRATVMHTLTVHSPLQLHALFTWLYRSFSFLPIHPSNSSAFILPSSLTRMLIPRHATIFYAYSDRYRLWLTHQYWIVWMKSRRFQRQQRVVVQQYCQQRDLSLQRHLLQQWYAEMKAAVRCRQWHKHRIIHYWHGYVVKQHRLSYQASCLQQQQQLSILRRYWHRWRQAWSVCLVNKYQEAQQQDELHRQQQQILLEEQARLQLAIHHDRQHLLRTTLVVWRAYIIQHLLSSCTYTLARSHCQHRSLHRGIRQWVAYTQQHRHRRLLTQADTRAADIFYVGRLLHDWFVTWHTQMTHRVSIRVILQTQQHHLLQYMINQWRHSVHIQQEQRQRRVQAIIEQRRRRDALIGQQIQRRHLFRLWQRWCYMMQVVLTGRQWMRTRQQQQKQRAWQHWLQSYHQRQQHHLHLQQHFMQMIHKYRTQHKHKQQQYWSARAQSYRLSEQQCLMKWWKRWKQFGWQDYEEQQQMLHQYQQRLCQRVWLQWRRLYTQQQQYDLSLITTLQEQRHRAIQQRILYEWHVYCYDQRYIEQQKSSQEWKEEEKEMIPAYRYHLSGIRSNVWKQWRSLHAESQGLRKATNRYHTSRQLYALQTWLSYTQQRRLIRHTRTQRAHLVLRQCLLSWRRQCGEEKCEHRQVLQLQSTLQSSATWQRVQQWVRPVLQSSLVSAVSSISTPSGAQLLFLSIHFQQWKRYKQYRQLITQQKVRAAQHNQHSLLVQSFQLWRQQHELYQQQQQQMKRLHVQQQRQILRRWQQWIQDKHADKTALQAAKQCHEKHVMKQAWIQWKDSYTAALRLWHLSGIGVGVDAISPLHARAVLSVSWQIWYHRYVRADHALYVDCALDVLWQRNAFLRWREAARLRQQRQRCYWLWRCFYFWKLQVKRLKAARQEMQALQG